MKQDFEEKELICEGCGKAVKRVVRKNSKITKFLCQQCAKKIAETE